jgi:hypothetical protein
LDLKQLVASFFAHLGARARSPKRTVFADQSNACKPWDEKKGNAKLLLKLLFKEGWNGG